MIVNASDFYERIEYLIKTSKQGFTEASIQVGSICTILLPGKHSDHRLSYEKETVKIIDLLSGLEQLPETFFEKPFFYPFSQNQLKQLKKQCWVKDPADGYQLEQKIIKLYEKILIKQQEKITQVSSNLEKYFFETLSTRISILDEAIRKINAQLAILENRKQNPGLFENSANAETKWSLLRTLEYNLQNIRDEYKGILNSNLDPELNVCEYLQATERNILEAFKDTRVTYLDKIQGHNNLFMKFLDAFVRTITFGFAHISTQSEAIVLDTGSSINNKF